MRPIWALCRVTAADSPAPLDVEQSDPLNTINVNGAMRYLQDIDIGLEEPTILVIAELLQAPTMGEFAREGFVDGWKTSGYPLYLYLYLYLYPTPTPTSPTGNFFNHFTPLTPRSCDTLDKMRARVPDLRFAFSHDEALFKKVYLFTYNFARSPNQKSLPLESAAEYWKLLFAKRFKTHMGNWIDFLETEYKRSIAKDTWNCMYDFVQLADGDPTLASYDTDGTYIYITTPPLFSLSPFLVWRG